jgi:hypothetical protein
LGQPDDNQRVEVDAALGGVGWKEDAFVVGEPAYRFSSALGIEHH